MKQEMKNKKRIYILLILVLLLAFAITVYANNRKQPVDQYVSYTLDPKLNKIDFYWKNDGGELLKSIKNLKTFVESKNLELVFAMNGGMYKKDNMPQGLFISQFETIEAVDILSGSGNFYLKPNGVFYITKDKKAVVCKTDDFVDEGQIEYATQSGPMLVIDGQIHTAFTEGSANLYVRNGVGVLPDGRVLFAMSKLPVNFYDFASYFKSLGCTNALYLDGYVSRTYLPEKDWEQTDGNFGVMIGVTKPTID